MPLTRLLSLLATATLLTACASLESNHPAQLIPAEKISRLHTGMSFAQFEATLGPGWLSTSSSTHEKYWFLDDCRILAVPPEIWQSPNRPVAYRIIGQPPPSTPKPLLLPTVEPFLPLNRQAPQSMTTP